MEVLLKPKNKSGGGKQRVRVVERETERENKTKDIERLPSPSHINSNSDYVQGSKSNKLHRGRTGREPGKHLVQNSSLQKGNGVRRE